MRFARSHLTMTTAVAALMLPVGALAQQAGFAIEVGPAADEYTPVRVGAHVQGPVSEPASSYVRGCQGSIMAEGDGVPFELTAAMAQLNFTAAGDGLRSMVLGTPDGLYRCALADDQGFAASALSNAGAGRYTVWLGADEGAQVDARLFASDRPVSPIELFGLNIARLGEPRAGRFVFAASAETGRQTLVSGGTLFAESEMRPLSTEYCAGFGRFDAADAVLTLDQASDRFSIFALSDRDLTLAVVDPSGRVTCNDDAYQLNPGVTLDAAPAGDYQIFVGGYSQGGDGRYDLFTSQGAPAFTNAILNLEAEPRAGRVAFDPGAAGQGQLLATAPVSANDPMEALPVGGFCPGFTDLSAPDLVMHMDGPQPTLSIYARSQDDLVLAVRAPDGSWSCNDDASELNPAVGFTNAQGGDYLVFVGAYNQGASGLYNLYASIGSPNWQSTTPGGGFMAPASLNTTAEPAVARIDYGPGTRFDPRLIFDIQPSQTEAFGMGDGCAGFITPGQPDVVIDAAEGLPQLMIYMVSDGDGTLVVAGPDGHLYCNDDFEQLNPGVMIPAPMPGAYAVFAGSYSGTGGMATLGVTIASPQWVMDREH